MAEDTERDVWIEQAIVQWEVPLLRNCFLLLGDAALAEDAVQETFVKAWKAFDSYRGETSEKNWLMRIAVNTCKDIKKSKWFIHINRWVRTDELPEPAAAFVPPDDTVITAILSLPEKLRRVIILRYYSEMTIDEIAAVTGSSRRTVQYRLEKSKAVLKEKLEGWYFDEQQYS